MPNPIKAFFEKKKRDAKFKLAGPGQVLGNAESAQQAEAARREASLRALQQRQQQPSTSRGSSQAQQNAAQAALSRFNQASGSSVDDFEKKRSQAVIRAQAQKEIQRQQAEINEAKKLKEIYGEKKEVVIESSPTCPGVFYHCPLLGPEVLPKNEMKEKIRTFLYDQLNEEPGLTSCLIIRTFAKNPEKAKICIETLCKYLDNILENPNDEKFRKIRKSNKAYLERVASCEGHDYFLSAVGFETQNIDDQEFWIFSGDLTEERIEMMKNLRQGLTESEPIRAELDRGLKVLYPQQASGKLVIPSEFYTLSAEEVKKEQQAKTEMLEREGMLRTKAMREREEQREKRRYRYTLIRVRFPDEIIVQGTFAVAEKYREIHDFIMECLEHPMPFVLYETGHRFESSDYDKTILDLGLVPSSILTFAWHPDIADEVKSQLGSCPQYLKNEVKSLLSTI